VYGCVIACRSTIENSSRCSVWSRPSSARAEIVADVQLAGRLDAAESVSKSRRPRGHKVRDYNDLVKLGSGRRYARRLSAQAGGRVQNWTEKSQHDFVTEAIARER